MSTNRLAALAHYVIWRCDPATLWAVKLYEILWFADLEYYRQTAGRSLAPPRTTSGNSAPCRRGIGSVSDPGRIGREEIWSIVQERLEPGRARPNLAQGAS
jgi:hypothetical protein